MSVDFVPLLGAALLLLGSVVAGLLSARIGLSFLLVFLLAGLAAGVDGPGGFAFDDTRLSFWVGNIALAVILLDGGARTAYATFRTGLKPSLVLATLGVVLTAVITAAAVVAITALDWPTALLLGSIVGSTDAAAVFATLRRSGVRLNERVAATLEIESGMNDPMAVFLTLAFIGLIGAAGGAQAPSLLDSAAVIGAGFVQQFGIGSVAGLAAGAAAALLLQRLPVLRRAEGALLALVLAASGLAVFAAAGVLGGSGFLAVYLYGIVVGNRAKRVLARALPAVDAYAWLAQAGMFLLLGLLATPSSMGSAVLHGLVVSAALMFVARPLAVWLCLLPFRFSAREVVFIAWVGLRGAVPIVLSLFPLLAGTPNAGLLFNLAFVVVLVSLLLQGTTLATLARRMGVALPDAADERQARAVFRDFALDASRPIGELCRFYDLPTPPQADRTLADWMAAELRRPPVIGDSVKLGPATLAVRALEGGRIRSVGLGLPAGPSEE
jgi:cell volume regulation protein A